jgi:hypothetical protein
MTEPRPDSFDWMLDRCRFRPSLRMIGRAVRGGVIDAAPARHRVALVDGLEALLDAPDLTTREAERLARLLAAIDQGGAPPRRASTASRTSTAFSDIGHHRSGRQGDSRK